LERCARVVFACMMTGAARCEGSASALAGFYCMDNGTAAIEAEASTARQIDEDTNGVLSRLRSAECRAMAVRQDTSECIQRHVRNMGCLTVSL
jgi:hypothetical protein